MKEFLESFFSKKLTTYSIIFGMHFVYFILAIIFQNIYLVDSFGYLFQAENLMNYGSWYAEDWNAPILIDYFSFRPPLYAAFIGIIKFIVNSNYAVLLVQNILSIVILFLIVDMAKRFEVKREFINMALLAFLIFAPTYIIMANMIMAETVFCFIIMVVLYAAFRLSYQYHIKYLFIITLGCSAAILTKPVALFLPLLLLTYFLIVWQKQKSIAIKSAVIIILFTITFHLICLQQQHQTEYYHYTSISAVTQQRYHARYTLANKFGENMAEVWNDSCKEELAKAPNFKTRYIQMNEMGTQVLTTYPITFLKLYTKGVITFFADPGRHDIFTFFGWRENEKTGLFHRSQSQGVKAIIDAMNTMPLAGLIILLFSLLANILAIAALAVFAWYEKSRQSRLVLMLVIYFALATGMLGVARYRTVIFPELLLCMALFFQTLHTRFKLHSGKQSPVPRNT
jgi:hypothetical protein